MSAELSVIARAAKAHWGYPDEWLELWADDLTVTPEDIERDHVFHAEVGRTVAGCCSLRVQGANAEIEHMWVLPEFSGTGVGRALFDRMVATARAAGVAAIRIVSDPNAVGFYETVGAHLVGAAPSVPEGRELPVLRYELTAAR